METSLSNISKEKKCETTTTLILHKKSLNFKIMQKSRYIRQSTKNQSSLRQYAKAHPGEILYCDIISGSIPFAERPEGRRLIQAVEDGSINYVTFHDLSRAGRSTVDVLTTLNYFQDKGVIVKIDNLGLESIIEGKVNPIFNLITTVLSEIYSLERKTLLERQAEGIIQAKLKNLYTGRQKGTKDSPELSISKHNRVVKVIKSNPIMSLRDLAKLATDKDKGYAVSPNTVKKIKELMTSLNMI